MILYIITRALTFAGAYMRTFWQHVVCRVCGIMVEDTRPLKSGELCGHIEHELLGSVKKSFWICFVPFTMNFIVGCMILLTGAYKILYIGEVDSAFNYIMLWLGISCIANCAPSYEDALVFKENLYSEKNRSKISKILLAPFFGICFAMAFVERYGITFVLAIAFSIAFPYVFGLVFPFIYLIIQ